jgi:hypothetical protein
MKIIRESETLSGTPMIEIDAAPLDMSGIPHVSDELAALLAPYLQGRDNISVRYIDEGLPTTSTVVVSEMYVELGQPVEAVRWYSARVIVFGTRTGKTGVNAHFQPVRIEMAKYPAGQLIPNGPIFNFREVYDDIESGSRDMERLLRIADEAYSNQRRKSTTPDSAKHSPKPWWRKILDFLSGQ